jgi:hypothetical protein
MMFVMSLLRFSGIVILLGFVFATVVVVEDRGILAGILPGTGVLLGLWMAVAGDDGIERQWTKKKRAQEREARREAEVSRGVSVTAGLRWILWLRVVLLGAGLTSIFVFLGLVTWSAGGYERFVFLFAGLCGMAILIKVLALGWQAARDDYLLRLDSSGFAHVAMPVIPWRDVLGVDIDEVPRRSYGLTIGRQRAEHLALALRRDAFKRMRLEGWRRFVYHTTLTIDASRQLLLVPCHWTSVPAATLLEATKRIGDSAGAPRIKSWRCFLPIEEAMRLEEWRDKAGQAFDPFSLLERQLANEAEDTR